MADSTRTIIMHDVKDLGRGFTLCRDDDGDWWLLPPADVTILSEPGEALLLDADNEADAETAALREMEADTPDATDAEDENPFHPESPEGRAWERGEGREG